MLNAKRNDFICLALHEIRKQYPEIKLYFKEIEWFSDYTCRVTYIANCKVFYVNMIKSYYEPTVIYHVTEYKDNK